MAERKLLETIQNFFRANKDYQPDFVESSAIMYKLSNVMLESAIEQNITSTSTASQRRNKQSRTNAKHDARQ